MKKRFLFGFILLDLTVAVGLCVKVSGDTIDVTSEMAEYDCYAEELCTSAYKPITEVVSQDENINMIDVVSEPTEVVDTRRVVEVPERENDFKSYMNYKVLTKYRQKDLQDIAKTDSDGFRVVDGRYLVAVGTAVSEEVGTYITLVLENGTEIDCIVGDIKDDSHTDEANIVTVANGCVSEFIIDKDVMPKKVLRRGSVSYAFEEWKSKVVSIIVEDRNYFN